MSEAVFDKDYILSFVKDILETDSPSGFTFHVFQKLKAYAQALGFPLCVSKKGTGIIEIPGESEKTIAICAHADTLGLMVRSVKADGRLSVTRIGGPILSTLDGEYCKIYTRCGKSYTGTILSNSTSCHVFEDADSLKRSLENMHVRLDEIVSSKADVEKLGIATGDFICIDPKVHITESGFIKSRFLDDKLCLGILFGYMKYLKDNGKSPQNNLKIFISSYEEVGHGMAFLPFVNELDELIALDMGCVGDDLNGSEQKLSICAKDSSGPYDYELTNRLISLADEHKLDFAVDIYPFYSSDASAALKAGADVKTALIGPGVAASHGMERSHYHAVAQTLALLRLYL